MHIGDKKRQILEAEIYKAVERRSSTDRRYLTVVELGSYCGYSSLSIASIFRYGDKLYSIEVNEDCTIWTRSVLEKAGASEHVEILLGNVENGVDELQQRIQPGTIDVLFIDHDKRLYLSDLIRFEESGLLANGCVVIADNVLSFGKPLTDYLEHVRNDKNYSDSVLYQSFIEYSVNQDFDHGSTTQSVAIKSNSGRYSEVENSANAQCENLDEIVDGVEVSTYCYIKL